MQIESVVWKRPNGRRGWSISARCASNLRGAMECTLVPVSSPRESGDPQGRQMQVLDGTQENGDSILE